jgi:hypothetical protein
VLTRNPNKINYAVKLNAGKGGAEPASGATTPASAS